MAALTLGGLLTMVALRPARADGSDHVPNAGAACVGPRISVDPSLLVQAPWREAIDATRRELAALRDVDACAEIELAARPTPELTARLPDGRTAVRVLSGPRDLARTAMALLVLLPTEPESPAGDAAHPAATPTGHAGSTPPPPGEKPRAQDAPVVGAASDAGWLALGIGPAGRVDAGAGRYAGVGGAIVAEAEIGRGIVGLTGEGYEVWSVPRAGQQTPPPRRTLAIGVLSGVRVVRGPIDIDLLATFPEVAFEVSSSAVGDDGGPVVEMDDVSGAEATAQYGTVALRAGVGVRAAVRLQSRLRAYAELGGDASLARLTPASMPAAARATLPGWGAGLSLGLLWKAL